MNYFKVLHELFFLLINREVHKNPGRYFKGLKLMLCMREIQIPFLLVYNPPQQGFYLEWGKG